MKDAPTPESVNDSTKDSHATYTHVLKYTGVFGGVQGLNMLISIIRNKLAALLIGRAGFALITVYNSISQLAYNTTNMGLPISIVQRVSELYEQHDEEVINNYLVVVRTWSLWSGLLGMLLCILLSPLISYLSFDQDMSHVMQVCAVAPMVFFSLQIACEISILKGLRRLKRIAIISLVSAIFTLLTTIPFFYFWRINGVLIALNVSTVAVCAVHYYFSTSEYPWRVKVFSKAVFQQGLPLLHVGLPYVASGSINALVLLAVPSLLMYWGTLEDVGVYRVGSTLMMSYASIILVAVESDYFPRLSSINHDVIRSNRMVNQQLEVCILILTPVLIVFLFFTPLAIRLLYSAEFMSAVNMTLCAVFYMFFHVAAVPIAYLSLAKGDSVVFFFMELIYDVVLFGLIAGGFYWGHLVGTGIALSLASIFDFLLVSGFYAWRYGFRFEQKSLLLLGLQSVCVLLTLLSCLFLPLPLRIVASLCTLLLSGYTSYRFLSRHTEMIQSLKEKINRKCRRNILSK